MAGLSSDFTKAIQFNDQFSTVYKAYNVSLAVSPIEVDVIDIRGGRYAEAVMSIHDNLEKENVQLMILKLLF